MYRSCREQPTIIELSQEKAKAVLRLKQSLIKNLKELQPDGLLSKDDIFKALDEFKASVQELVDFMNEDSAEFDEDSDN